MTYAKVCGECYMWAGQHADWCSTRGYQYPATKHAPVKLPPATVQGDCPCGRARSGCEYHDPALQPPDTVPAKTYEVEDLTFAECCYVEFDADTMILLPLGAVVNV